MLEYAFFVERFVDSYLEEGQLTQAVSKDNRLLQVLLKFNKR